MAMACTVTGERFAGASASLTSSGGCQVGDFLKSVEKCGGSVDGGSEEVRQTMRSGGRMDEESVYGRGTARHHSRQTYLSCM